MSRLIRRIIASLFTSLLLLTLVSCGGGGSGSTDTSAHRTGTVGVLLTDMPADPSLFSSINATIVKVELIDTDDDERIPLYDGDPRTVDLLRLKNEAIPFTFSDDVPIGTYCKIRLTLSDLQLVLADNTPDDATDNETYHPHIPGNGKLDLVARDCFDVDEGRVATLQLDIDAGRSIHVTGNGNSKKYQFRPVIFVDVISQEFESKLVRLDGVITRIDPDNNSLLLCDAVTAHKSDSPGCVKIHFGENSAFFDNLEYAGAPRSIDELLSETKLDKDATVIGWARHQVILERDDDDDYDHHAWMEIDALVVELGDFLQVEGEVATNADSDGFGMTVSSSSAVITDDTLDVVLQPGSPGINGTRIISQSGEFLDYTHVTVPRPVQVDGVLELVQGSNAMLKSALVIVDTDTEVSEQVTGIILSLGNGNFIIAPDTDTVCGVTSNQIFVTLTDDVELLTVVITNLSSEISPGGSLEVGLSVGMNGACEGGDFITDNVVIVDDQR